MCLVLRCCSVIAECRRDDVMGITDMNNASSLIVYESSILVDP